MVWGTVPQGQPEQANCIARSSQAKKSRPECPTEGFKVVWTESAGGKRALGQENWLTQTGTPIHRSGRNIR